MLSKFHTGCSCDCCIVYKSRFCDNWYSSVFGRKYFGSTDGNPSTMNLNGGTFNEIGVFKEEPYKIWQIKNDACNLTSCGDYFDPKNYSYHRDVYLTPTGNLAGTYLSTLKVANNFQWWMYTFWDTCDSTDGSHCWDADESEPVRNQVMLFIFDYKDPDNWTGIRIEYKPNFNITPGQVGQVFEASGRQNVAGTESMLTETLTFDFGTGNTKAEIGIEINCDQRTECGSDRFVAIFFGEFEMGFRYTPVGGDRIACSQVTPSGVVDTIYCDGEEYRINEGFGIYNWVIEYLESQEDGCAEYGGCCSCYTPSEFDVTFSGFGGTDCDICDDVLNDTFSLKHVGKVEKVISEEPFETETCCRWEYYWDPYNMPTCTVDDTDEMYLEGLWLDLCPEGKWELTLITRVDCFGSELPPIYYFRCFYYWNYDEGVTETSLCNLTGSETFTYDSNQEGCVDYCGVGTTKQFSHWCDTTGTVTVENG